MIKRWNFRSTADEENSLCERWLAWFPRKNVGEKRGGSRKRDWGREGTRERSSSLRPDMSFGTWVTYLFVSTGQPAANQEVSTPLLLVTMRDSRDSREMKSYRYRNIIALKC